MKKILVLMLAMVLLTACSPKKQVVIDEPAETKKPVATTTPIKDSLQEIIDAMTIEEKIAQLFFVTPENIPEGVAVGGVILFGNNITTPEEVKLLNYNFKEKFKIEPFIGVDEEGGTVSRIAQNSNMGYEKTPSMSKIETTEEAKNAGANIGKMLFELGFNVDFAPVADIWYNSFNSVVKERSFGSDKDDVARKVSAFISGMHESGIAASVKHFPGHGATVEDSHEKIPVLDMAREEIYETQLEPFIKGIESGVEFVMVGHIAVPKITGTNVPSSLSPDIVSGILKTKLKFEGIAITDGMNMGGIVKEYSSKEAALMAIEAGCDMILVPENFEEAYDAILKGVASGTIDSERINDAIKRILTVKMKYNMLEKNL